MTFVELQSDAHGALAKTRWSKLCSRRDGNRLADIIAAEWVVMQGGMPPTKEEARAELMLRCKRRIKNDKVGFAIITIILSAILSALVKILIEYWWQKWKDRDKDKTEGGMGICTWCSLPSAQCTCKRWHGG